jgi:hypothetical protein
MDSFIVSTKVVEIDVFFILFCVNDRISKFKLILYTTKEYYKGI